MADGFRQLADMELSDDEKLDRMIGADVEPPDYPPGLRFRVCEADFAALGIDGGATPGDSIRFAALGHATNVRHDRQGTRIEFEIDLLALGDGKLTELGPGLRPCLCLTDAELEKLDCEEECESGDLLHLTGTVRVEGTEDTVYGGKALDLQITQMAVEDEDEESA